MRNEIEKIWEKLASNGVADDIEKDSIRNAIKILDTGKERVAEKKDGLWIVNSWLKKAILLYFKTSSNALSDFGAKYYDKVPLKTSDWHNDDFKDAQFRSVVGSVVRHGAFIGKNCILMPSFVNIGAHVGDGTMVDTWATIGSCAQIGKNCHISGGVGIGGVLEPLQANPVIIEDNVFIGARSEIAEGVIVGEGSVISMGVFIG
ncbi:MAG: 2,3,4,5-tetrahydropyridine-2,6-dicarboxylate N-succinyltransferase, partial [Alphaproteobacteria bacterium]